MKYLIGVVSLLALGCGVKGDPSPPDKPVEIGRGKPTYKSAMEKVKLVPETDLKKNAKKNRDEDDADEDDGGEKDDQE